ncbi:patatin-like phospholipase family protein [Alteromonas sp. KUL49]|uniref:patatin-like phospholipase family protein n=1 Tax=Alteromonas sp. KUL49 TaxID=2480798 RepID=UPI00102F2582|nr:patatin-like phospholipase family protein [Alteromonas sp. KUL49]TAP40809.1 patatin [Alteromonas sp. KUL49]GEA10986.1 hypothetical protein KUL49_13610 [Alteromonas sp. KUL49]
MKIGLALGAGAARGWTHIGVIRALERLGIQIDVVSGCSIGAYVGAAYASGRLDELHDWAVGLTEWQVLGLLGVGLRRGGIVSGQKVFDKLASDFSLPTFEEMHKPFACVATDIHTGREVTFNHGNVATSVQASCAIPALFSPVAHEGRWLVDGAVVNPVPVNLCRQLGADYVIAVNLNADFRHIRLEKLRKDHEENQRKTDDFFTKSHNALKQLFKSDNSKESEVLDSNDATAIVTDGDVQSDSQELQVFEQEVKEIPPLGAAPGIMNVMSSALEILQARVTRSRLAGEPPDILIEPQLTDVGIMEFHRAGELCLKGEATVERLAEQIRFQLLT